MNLRYWVLRLVLALVLSAVLFGCGRSETSSEGHVRKSVVQDDDIDRDLKDQARNAALFDMQQRQNAEAERVSSRSKEQAREKEIEQQRLGEQQRRARLCAELLGDLRADLKVSLSESAKTLLGHDYSIELRPSRHPISQKFLDLDELHRAIAAKKWMEVINILVPDFASLPKDLVNPPTEYPDDNAIVAARRIFLGSEFFVLIKTRADLRNTCPLTLSEAPLWVLYYYDFGQSEPCECAYVNGKLVRYTSESSPPWNRGTESDTDPDATQWTRVPDGSGWYCSWHPGDGEIIIIPRSWAPLGGSRSRIDRTRSNLWMSTPDLAGAMIPSLKEKFKLGYMTYQQISEVLDKAAFEGFQIRRKAALAL